MAAPKRIDYCPKCYLENGIDEPLIYRLGSTKPLECGNNHVYEDREELSTLTRTMLDQKKALAPKADPPPPVLEEPLPPPDQEKSAKYEKIEGIQGMVIPPVDMARLTMLLGTFRDSSTLFGTIYALKEELKDTQELLRRMQATKAVANTGSSQPPRTVGGDVSVQLVIPERHVGPINEIAEANGMDVTRYMNAKVEDGLDNYWFY